MPLPTDHTTRPKRVADGVADHDTSSRGTARVPYARGRPTMDITYHIEHSPPYPRHSRARGHREDPQPEAVSVSCNALGIARPQFLSGGSPDTESVVRLLANQAATSHGFDGLHGFPNRSLTCAWMVGQPLPHLARNLKNG